jgi:hypothetical protein
MCLGSGAVLEAALGSAREKGNDEQALLRTLLDTLHVGDLLLGNAHCATYFAGHLHPARRTACAAMMRIDGRRYYGFHCAREDSYSRLL